ncbi:MAG: DUF1987 domain-containing protein, partial [Bacteroidia bacterium]|nr:DUF1987 domain-containing protein [Bacteroidia bacterium]
MDNCEKIIEYTGHLTQETIEKLLKEVSIKMEEKNLVTLYKKKVYGAMVECLDNIYKHCDNTFDSKACDTKFYIEKHDNSIEIISQNSILNENIPALKDKIELINKLSKSEIKELYKNTILNANITDKGGAGLGIINIVKISGNKLSYEFIPIDNKYSCFILNIKISFYKMNCMDATLIQATEKSPKVMFDPENGIFEMEGDSRPENVRRFYQPIIDMVKAYFDDIYNENKIDKFAENAFKFNFKLGYFNSSSAKFILDILTIVNDFRKEG